jgi:hypothetical protein
MDTNENVRLSVVLYMQSKLYELESRKVSLEKQHEASLKQIREETYLYTKLMQDACPHSDKVTKEDWNYHNNVDDSYDECKICGKRL